MTLEEKIKNSLTFNYYNKLLKLTKYKTSFKWIAGILFCLGFVDMLLFDKVHNFIMYLLVLVWIPGLLFAITTGVLHFLVGRKIKLLSIEYNIDKKELMKKL